jgi:integrase
VSDEWKPGATVRVNAERIEVFSPEAKAALGVALNRPNDPHDDLTPGADPTDRAGVQPSQGMSDAIIAKMHDRHPGQVANLVQFWMWTGLRTSEIFGLSWSSVDLRSGTAVIHEALVRGKHKESTKTDEVRTVRLNSMALAAITAQKEHTFLKGGRVFHDPRYAKEWDDERAFRRSFWEPVLKALSMRYRRPYNMRHTYATFLLMAKRNPAWCAKQLGHDVKVFLTVYAKWIDGDADDREMQGLEAAIAPASKKENTG